MVGKGSVNYSSIKFTAQNVDKNGQIITLCTATKALKMSMRIYLVKR